MFKKLHPEVAQAVGKALSLQGLGQNLTVLNQMLSWSAGCLGCKIPPCLVLVANRMENQWWSGHDAMQMPLSVHLLLTRP